jgi:hypothetical protein
MGSDMRDGEGETRVRDTRTSGNGRSRPPLAWWRWVGTILVIVTGALTAYYTTVYGIRLTVNEKADRGTVERIDHRLVEIETILRTSMVHRSDLAALREAVDNRLTRIETLLEERQPSP